MLGWIPCRWYCGNGLQVILLQQRKCFGSIYTKISGFERNVHKHHHWRYAFWISHPYLHGICFEFFPWSTCCTIQIWKHSSQFQNFCSMKKYIGRRTKNSKINSYFPPRDFKSSHPKSVMYFHTKFMHRQTISFCLPYFWFHRSNIWIDFFV